MRNYTAPTVTLFKRKDSPYWHVSFFYKGERERQATPYTTRTEAEQHAKKMTDILRRKFYGLEEPPPKPPISLRDLADAYIKSGLAEGQVRDLTREVQSQRVNWFVAQLGGDRAAESIGEDAVIEWIGSSLKRQAIGRNKKLSATTVHNYLVAAKACYRWGLRRGLISTFPWQYARIPKAVTHRNIRIPEEDMLSIVSGLDLRRSQHRSIFLASFCGLRQEDHKAMHWEDWDWKTGVLRWKTNKNGQPITVVLPDAALAALNAVRGIGAMVPYPGTWATWERITKDLCGNKYSVKWFRHTFETGLAEAGVDFGVRQRLMGHASQNSTLGYEHVSVERLREAVNKLPWSRNGHAEVVSV
jgi:integrase